jgi:hypothetical protein
VRFFLAHFLKFGTFRIMSGRPVTGYEEGKLIRKVNPEYARRAAGVVKMLEAKFTVGGAEHLKAVRAGLRGQKAPKRTED